MGVHQSLKITVGFFQSQFFHFHDRVVGGCLVPCTQDRVRFAVLLLPRSVERMPEVFDLGSQPRGAVEQILKAVIRHGSA